MYCFGKLAPKLNAKTLDFSRYVKMPLLPTPPSKAYWEYKVPEWGVFGNDKYGDCTIAAIAHMLMSWTAHTGQIVTPTLQQVLDVYSAITGFNQASGMNDNGAAMTDVYEYWTNTGIPGHKIDGWVQIDFKNIEHVKLAIYLFGAVNPGINMPQSAMDQFNAGKNWDVEGRDGGIIGGHSVPFFGFGSDGTTGITWGKLQRMSWAFWQKYVDECYAAISLDWLEKDGNAPSHLDLVNLRTDLQTLQG